MSNDLFAAALSPKHFEALQRLGGELFFVRREAVSVIADQIGLLLTADDRRKSQDENQRP
jgi:hypothetical protein